ncbi:UNVERIFIED_CONTAM: hypothetical protein GTU68_024176 [Idotea baltica]|nr:hypothetical protein [Idotea baltica]
MKRVLILCTGNSCRSQMAEGLFRVLSDGQWESHSAGSKPSGYVHPLAIRAMSDHGVDISGGVSKSVDEFNGQEFDLVVTVCDNAHEACPIFPGAKDRQHWPFDDPADATGSEEEQLKVFGRVRDEIEQTIAGFLSTQ